MKKEILLLLFCLFSFSAIHAEKSWEINGIKCNLSDDGTFTISGTGNMPNYNSPADIPWYNYQGNIEKVVIKDGVTSIGKNAFSNCLGLTSITIPNSVTSIGERAFEICSSLTSLTIPNSVTSIGDCAFHLCRSLTSVTIPNSVTSIGNYAFSECSSLTSFTIPNSVTSIGHEAFENCSSLTSLTIPNSVTSIGNYAFRYCSGLTSITVEKGNTKYDSRDNCNAIIETNTNKLIAGCKNTTIPNSVTSIGGFAFEGCSGLTSITIPNSVTSIENGAFDGCSGLTSITFERTTPPEFGEDVFYKVDKSISVYVPANRIEAYKGKLKNQENSNLLNIKAAIHLTDNDSYTQDSSIDGADVSYTRNFTNVKWQALYLPFSLKYEDWKDDFEMAYINGIIQRDNDDDGEIDETEVEIIKMKSGSTRPNAPYLIRAKTTGEKTLSVKNTTVYAAPEESYVDCSTTTATFFFVGTYETIPYETLIAKKYYAMGGGELVMSNGSDLKPFRWFMDVVTRSYHHTSFDRAKVITLKVLDEEETTGVANIQHPSPNTQIFDLNGRKVNENSLKPGIYVKNGKKFVVK